MGARQFHARRAGLPCGLRKSKAKTQPRGKKRFSSFFENGAPGCLHFTLSRWLIFLI
ncbi:MAG: hypothetical protein ACTTJV_01400 [Ottowia sp.]